MSPIGTPGFRWSPGFLKSPVDFLGHNLCHTCEDCATICGHSVAVRALEPLPAALRKTDSCSQLCMRQHSFGHWLIGLSNLAFCVRTSDIFILVAEPSSNCCLRYGRKHCPGKLLSGVWCPEGQLYTFRNLTRPQPIARNGENEWCCMVVAWTCRVDRKRLGWTCFPRSLERAGDNVKI